MDYHHKENFKNKYKILGNEIIFDNLTQVFKGKNKNSGEIRAIKVINLNGIKKDLESEFPIKEVNKEFKKYIKSLMNEINIMKICGKNNHHSVKFYESFETEDEFAIIMELCDQSLA